MASPRICIIATCNRALSPNARSEICPVCRSSLGYWKKKRPSEILERRRKLRLYDERMEQLAPAKPNLKVVAGGRRR